MSIKIMNLVWENAPYSENTLLTFLALADWSNDAGESWPSMKTLAKKTRQSERNCQRILRSLEKEGYIDTKFRKENSSVYRINLSTLYRRGENIAPGGGDNISPGDIDDMEGVTLATEGVTPTSPNTPIIHTSVDTPEPLSLFEPKTPEPTPPSKSKNGKVPPEQVEAVREVWDHFVEKAGKPRAYLYTPKRESQGVSRLKELMKNAVDPPLENARDEMKAMVDRMVEDSWYSGKKDGKKHLQWEYLFSSPERMTKWLE
jgi:hypothetical protein